jgi:hypothetical protein
MQGHRTTSTLLELLDSHVRPGVTEAEFRKLFVQCKCEYFFTKRAYRGHACSKAVIDLTEEEVIDLTDDN